MVSHTENTLRCPRVVVYYIKLYHNFARLYMPYPEIYNLYKVLCKNNRPDSG